MIPQSPLEDAISRLRETYACAMRLVLYRGILQDPVVKAWLDLVGVLLAPRTCPESVHEKLASAYAKFFSCLGEEASRDSIGRVGSPWQNHLLNLILNDENPFSRRAEEVNSEELGISLTEQGRLDLKRLQHIHDLESGFLLEAVRKASGEMDWVDWDQFPGGQLAEVSLATERIRLKQQFHASHDWSLQLVSLVEFYRGFGTGILGQFRAFHWEHSAEGGRLRGIPEPDPIRLEDLIGCEDQKNWLVRNTLFFLCGYPANNILVYGDRGTGKSSAIKALIHHFSGQRLQMVEVSRDDLRDLLEVMNILRNRSGRFIVFIDDLSFEEGETLYKTLKALLEGSLEARPGNVLIYATSNRRHLIREYFSDRNSFNDEVRHQDTLQEKVSLADRFGIQLVFVAPDQAQYLEIIRSMASRRDVQLPSDELERQALEWAQLHNGRSGRTACQFIDFLDGELGQVRGQGVRG